LFNSLRSVDGLRDRRVTRVHAGGDEEPVLQLNTTTEYSG